MASSRCTACLSHPMPPQTHASVLRAVCPIVPYLNRLDPRCAVLCRQPTGHLIRQLLNQHPQKPLFVVVRPHTNAKAPLADLATLLSAQAATRSPSIGAEPSAAASVGSGTAWQPANLSPFPDGATTPWESVSSGRGAYAQVRRRPRGAARLFSRRTALHMDGWGAEPATPMRMHAQHACVLSCSLRCTAGRDVSHVRAETAMHACRAQCAARQTGGCA